MIRAQVRDIDLQGQAVVANVIFKDVEGAAVRWRGGYRYNVEFGTTLELATSVSDTWRDIEYNAGVDLRDYARGDYTPQNIYDGAGDLIEERFDVGDVAGFRGAITFNAAKNVGETLLRVNTQINGEVRDGKRVSERTPVEPPGPPNVQAFPEDLDLLDIEIGLDAEREIGTNLLGKAILLHFDKDQETISTQRSFDADGVLTRLRISDTQTHSSETIARFELNWTRWPNHVLQFNVEGAFNSLDNALLQTNDTGDGPVIVDVPGANSQVEEIRGDMLLKDTWTIGAYELEYGLGFEVSTIEQSGDAELERSFTYVKPQLALTYAPGQGAQTRLRIAREVSQLDFNDFVSATVFEDNDLALGNPDLQPETAWRAEISHERRFGRESVVKILAFHDWVSDVEDLLPLTPNFEAPGNIGDGRRWGFEIESTLPLDRYGLRGAKLDFAARWQDSTVVDPVTGEDRIFSAGERTPRLLPLEYRMDNEYAIVVDFRQDLQRSQVAWGWDIRSRAERPNFKVNELVVEDEETEFNVFVETTRWLGIKINLAAQNIFDVVEKRDRILYVGERDLSPVDQREVRRRVRGFRFALEFSGSF